MTASGQLIELSDNNQNARAYLALPEGGTGSGILVIQEWWGLNAQIKGVTDFLATQGFVALAPDLYRGELAGHDEMDKATKLMTELPPEQAAKDMSAAVDYLLELDATTSDGIGVIGFCMGGMLSLMLAANRGDAIKAAVPFYGFPQGDGEPNWENLTAVVRGHFANPDDFFKPAVARELESRLRKMDKDVAFTVHDAKHAFMNEENPLGSYDQALAGKIWPEVCNFFHETLS